jgi:hypothetical protein
MVDLNVATMSVHAVAMGKILIEPDQIPLFRKPTSDDCLSVHALYANLLIGKSYFDE